MPVPSSGPISFTVIAENLSPVQEPPYSLNEMSNAAGFSSPHSVGEFYGYSPGGGGLTLFFRSDSEYDVFEACFRECPVPVWHNGAGALPNIGDIVYDDDGGIHPIISSEGYWGMATKQNEPGYLIFATNKDQGNVVDVQSC